MPLFLLLEPGNITEVLRAAGGPLRAKHVVKAQEIDGSAEKLAFRATLPHTLEVGDAIDLRRHVDVGARRPNAEHSARWPKS